MIKSLVGKLIASAALISMPVGAAYAATTTGILAVSSVTVGACIVVATPMVFGTLNLIGASPNDSTATVTVTCTPGTGFNVGLDNGANFAGGTRRMKSATAAAYVPYTLTQDASHATPWGTTIGTNTVAGTAVVLPTLLTVYGRVPAGTTPVAADAYLDTVTVTVTY